MTAKTVPAYVPAKLPTPIAFVGAAPSEEDMVGNAPFIGPDGRLFNSILRTAGLERDRYLLTNVYDALPEDDLAEFTSDKAYTEQSFARLAGELAKAKPNVIVPLGPTALWAFTGFSSITPFRGSQTRATRIVPGAKLVPTFHPEMIRKQWKFLSVAVADFIKAERMAAQGPELVYPEKEIHLLPLERDVKSFLRETIASPLMSVDIETGWGQITSIQFSPAPFKRAMTIPFFDLRKPSRSYWGSTDIEVRIWRMVEEALASETPKIGQNFTYDTYWLLWKMGFRVQNYLHDTRLMHHAIFPELPKDLAFLGGMYTDLGAWKQMGGRYSGDKRDN